MFDQVIVHVLENEGGFVDHKADPGGATNYGVSLRFLKTLGQYGDFNNDGLIDVKDIRAMDIEDAKALYKKFWWDKYKYRHIESPKIAGKLLDMSINVGSYRAHCILQHALNDSGCDLLVDGIIGWKTIAAINKHKKIKDQNLLLTYMIVNLAKYYLELYDNDKENRVNFIVGWLKRALKRFKS